MNLLKGNVLDFGCGYGFDADHFGWEAYDPYYRNVELSGLYDSIVCNHVLNALTRHNRAKVIVHIQKLLTDHGRAFLAVPRDLPVTGKLGMHHSLQNYVVLTLPSVYADKRLEIYIMQRDSQFADKTKDYVSRRDRRRDA